MPRSENPTVYSTEHGDLRKQAKQSSARKPSLPPNQQTAYLHRESKGRGGKTVTLIKNLVLSDDELKGLAKLLKQACGVGGTAKDGVLEIQGDQREKIAQVLSQIGYRVKIAGG
jgi:translation initiation factor 1